MKKYLSYLMLAVVLLMMAKPTAAQRNQNSPSDIRKMSLEEVLTITEEENFQVRMAGADMEIARSQYRQTNAVFLPSISVEETGISTNDPLNVFGFRLKQESVTASDFTPSRLNAPDPFENFTTKFEVQQPLLNTDMLLKRGAAKNQLNASKESFEGTLQKARFQVKDTYYQLLLMDERLTVIEKSLQAARENEKQANDFYEQDMISKADYLAAKVRLLELESQQSRVQDQLETVRENLRYLLGFEQEVQIVPTDTMQVRSFSPANISSESVTNSELEALQYRVSAAEQMLKSSKYSFLPSLNLFGSYEFNDDVLFGTRGESYMVGATLKWNLFSGFSNVGKVMEYRADLKKAKLAYDSRAFRNKLEIEQAKRSANQALTQLNFAESSISQAEEDFRIRQNRYEQGMEKTTDLLNTEAKLAQARFERLDAIYQYNLSVAKLELLLEQEITYQN